MKRWLSSFAIAVPALLLAREAAAVRNPDRLAERALETADGGPARIARAVAYQAPATGAAAWQRFTAAHGAWQAMWDADTGVPVRIWGEGVATPGASADATIAEAAARSMLAAQLGLLAPGGKLTDWQLVSNTVHGRGDAMRTVGFVQVLDGVPVQDGAISFLFKRDRLFLIGSQALPSVTVRAPTLVVTGAAATDQAVAWIGAAYGAVPTVLAEGGVSILPIIRDRAIEYRVVKTVTLDLAPRGQWDVFVDAETGLPVARRQRWFFGTGVLKYNTPLRYPAAGRADFLAAFANLSLGASALVTDVAGGFSYPGAGPAVISAGVVGPRVRVTSDGGPGVTSSITIPDGGTGVWSGGSNAPLDGQLTAFAHVNFIKAFAKAELNPGLAWLDRQLVVDVNRTDDVCNARASDNLLMFYVAGSGCENTARLPDVVYHEFGHSLHFASIVGGAGNRDSALSEGTADYLAATTVDDPGMGRGFGVGSSEPLRHLDPIGFEHVWPRDIRTDPHATGLIIAGALWDARKALVTQYGAAEGKRKADDVYYAILQRASDISVTYPEALAADDDDGNLTNGTPNLCLLTEAFGRHGLLDPHHGLGIARPIRDGHTVSFAVSALPGGCVVPQVTSATLEWKIRGGTLAPISLVDSGGTFTAVIPTQPSGTVVEYRVIVRVDNGQLFTFPDNAADTLYQFYVGPVATLYCTDFESDPFANGWTHVAQTGNDDWQWGTPTGLVGDADPPSATSGTKVVGQDLGLDNRDGRYGSSSFQTLISPVIDTTGATGVRLQYQRWLGVEDGFYDSARILVNGAPAWRNFASANDNATTHHRDREWRFHDLDLGAAAASGSVQVRFELESDQELQLGGWAIDDFCVVATSAPGVAVCGNAQVEDGETCDDGNLDDGDGCSAICGDDGDDGGCCSTGTDPRGAIAIGLGSAILVLRRRRRPHA